MFNTILPIVIGVLSRIMPHPANFTAVGGLALFSGARYGLRAGFVITAATMFISDVVVGFHAVMWATYGSLIFTVFLGTLLRGQPHGRRIIGLSFLSSVLFYLITNFAVWAQPGSMYPKTTAGLIASYIAALPFFRNSLAGDLFYTSVFFGIAQLITLLKSRYHQRVYGFYHSSSHR